MKETMSEDKEISKARRKKIPEQRKVSGLEILESERSRLWSPERATVGQWLPAYL
jgi:hypothetical protein